MGCKTYLYDTQFTALQNRQILLVASDGPTVLDSQTNGPLPGGGWGANLAFSPQAITYTVYVDDRSGQNAAAIVKDLNGHQPGRLDLVIAPVPSGRHGGMALQPRRLPDVGAAMRGQWRWSEAEQLGVIGLVRAVLEVESSGDNAPDIMREAALRWRAQLDELGIDLSQIDLGSDAGRRSGGVLSEF